MHILPYGHFSVKETSAPESKYAYLTAHKCTAYRDVRVIRFPECDTCRKVTRSAGGVFRPCIDDNGDTVLYRIPQLKCDCGRLRALIPGILPFKHYSSGLIEEAASAAVKAGEDASLGQRTAAAAKECFTPDLTTLALWCKEICLLIHEFMESERRTWADIQNIFKADPRAALLRVMRGKHWVCTSLHSSVPLEPL